MEMFMMIQLRVQMAGWRVCFALWLLGLMQHPRTSALSPNAFFDAELAIGYHR